MCGLFGIRSPERDVARLTYFGLFALQHRGQESAGIAVSDGGLEVALAEAAEHSGRRATVEAPPDAPGGRVVLACAPDDVDRLGKKNVVRIGTVD